MRRTHAVLLCAGLLGAGCDPDGGLDLPDDALVDEIKASVELAVSAGDRARTALELLGLLPTYECGEPRRTFVGRAVDGFAVEHACGTASAEAIDDDRDAVVLDFPAPGCPIDGRTLSGELRFVYSGGQDRLALAADLSGLEVDGESLDLTVGYDTCGDEQAVSVAGQEALGPGVDFSVDLRLALRAGIPIFGSASLVLDGEGALERAVGRDRLEFEAVEYEPGSLLPKQGTIRLQTAAGHSVEARFSEGFLLDEVELRIDDCDPVSVPLF